MSWKQLCATQSAAGASAVTRGHRAGHLSVWCRGSAMLCAIALSIKAHGCAVAPARLWGSPRHWLLAESSLRLRAALRLQNATLAQMGLCWFSLNHRAGNKTPSSKQGQLREEGAENLGGHHLQAAWRAELYLMQGEEIKSSARGIKLTESSPRTKWIKNGANGI